MNKISPIIMAAILFMSDIAVGAEMCVRTNTYISVFRQNVNGNSAECSNSDTDKIWKVSYDYRDITGFASCNALDSTTNPTTVVTTGATTGTNCWCKIAPVPTYTNDIPTGVVSYWVHLKTYDSAESCNDGNSCNSSHSGCTASCMNAMKSDAAFRGKIFNSIW